MGETRGLRGWAATHFFIATTVNYIPGQSSIQLTQSRRGSNTDRGDRRARVSSARAGQTTEPSAGRKPATPAKRQDMNASNHCRQMSAISVLQRQPSRPAAPPSDPATPAGRRHARKTAKAHVLMAEAWARTPSIGRTGMLTPVCEAARVAPADAACLGSGSAARTLVHPCIGRLSVAGGTARARWLQQLAAVC